MSAVTPYHVPQTVTSDVPSTLTCYKLNEVDENLNESMNEN